MKPYCFAGDIIKDASQAFLHAQDIGLIRGYGVFDFFRTVNGVPLFGERYLDRFIRSAERAYLPLPYAKNELNDIIDELIRKNELIDGGVRMVLSGGLSENHFTPSGGSLFIFCELLSMPPSEKYERGVALQSVDYVRPMAEIKTTNYALPCMLSKKWKEGNIEDVLYYHQGKVSESSRSNLFMVKEGKLHTPKSDILHGITREQVIALADEVAVRDIYLDEILEADEVFITSTTKRILPVTRIDDKKIGPGKPGPITMDLLFAFTDAENLAVNRPST